ncbi:MAG: DMT family transporter [Rudaea sp.]
MEFETEVIAPSRAEVEKPETEIGRGAGYLFIFGAAALWGSMGLFFTVLHERFHLSALNIAFLRAAVPALILLVSLGIFRRSLLNIPREALVRYVAFGFFGVALFYILAVQGVILTSVATASVLLYTAPAFVTLFAWRMWHEPITGRKLAALVGAFAGCALVARAYDPAQLSLNWVGILVATLAGLGYATFTVFSKASTRQPPWTTITYSLLFGALFLLPLQFWEIGQATGESLAPLVVEPFSWVWVAGLAFGPTLGSYILYNTGLRRVPASNASIVATIEPVVAGVLGFILLNQTLEPLQILGGAMVVGAAFWLTRG